MKIASSSSGRIEGPQGQYQKIPDWLIKILFLVKTETAVRLGIKSGFSNMGFNTSDTIWGVWCFS